VTDLEKQALTDGFRVLLLGCVVDAGQDAIVVRAQLFDGGRPREDVNLDGPFWEVDPGAFRDVSELAARVASPPHVTVVYGRNWRRFLDDHLADVRDDLLVLDLPRTARVLADLAPGATDSDIAGAYNIAHIVVADSPLSPSYEDLLWAVIEAAGKRGLSWQELISLPDDARSQPRFEDYEFGEAALGGIPSAPGVYIMRDANLDVLYVGKSADLASRVGSYFRRIARLPAKLECIRDRISSLEYELCGSELEALLLENRFIDELAPVVNVQRSIVPGSSRYRPKAGAIMVVLPSVARRRIELFFFGSRERALQLRIVTNRPPTAVLERLVLYLCEERKGYRGHPHLTDWGAEGAEICYRYWSRCRDALDWIELGLDRPVAETVALLKQAIGTAARTDAAAEFRLSAG